MVAQKTLFNDDQHMDEQKDLKKEVMPLEKLKSLEDKIATAIEKVKTLKEEKTVIERRLRGLEELLNEKSQEIEQLKTEKDLIKSQLESLLNEIEKLELD